MIFDKENLFLDGVAASGMTNALSNVVVNGEGGNAANPLYLFAGVKGGDAGKKITVVLETADVEAFTTPVTLGTFEGTATAPVKAKLPIGAKKYLRLKVTSTFTAGTVTAGLVNDVDHG